MTKRIYKSISLFLCLLLCLQQSSFAQVAVELNIASHLSALHNSLVTDKFRPVHLRYLQYDPRANNFQLLLDKGDSFSCGRGNFPPSGGDIFRQSYNEVNNRKVSPVEGEESVPEQEDILKKETQTLLNYFLIGLTLPNDTFWVNLRPDSPDNIIDGKLAQTDIGKIMLETDLQLKKDTASATSPQTKEGKEYWDKLYKKAEELYGSENVTIPTLTRPWIVPGEIIIRESQGTGYGVQGIEKQENSLPSAYIYKATLKVMLEEDYLKSAGCMVQGASDYSFKDERSKTLNEYSTQLIRELIIPKLTKEVNSSKRYAPLRQVYYSLIMAQWFKVRATTGGDIFRQSYNEASNRKVSPVIKLINSQNLTNLTSKQEWSKDTYFQAYKKSFAEGQYNIQEPVYTPTGQVIRSYFSGGESLGVASSAMTVIPAQGNLSVFPENLISISSSSPADAAFGSALECIRVGKNKNIFFPGLREYVAVKDKWPKYAPDFTTGKYSFRLEINQNSGKILPRGGSISYGIFDSSLAKSESRFHDILSGSLVDKIVEIKRKKQGPVYILSWGFGNLQADLELSNRLKTKGLEEKDFVIIAFGDTYLRNLSDQDIPKNVKVVIDRAENLAQDLRELAEVLPEGATFDAVYSFESLHFLLNTMHPAESTLVEHLNELSGFLAKDSFIVFNITHRQVSGILASVKENLLKGDRIEIFNKFLSQLKEKFSVDIRKAQFVERNDVGEELIVLLVPLENHNKLFLIQEKTVKQKAPSASPADARGVSPAEKTEAGTTATETSAESVIEAKEPPNPILFSKFWPSKADLLAIATHERTMILGMRSPEGGRIFKRFYDIKSIREKLQNELMYVRAIHTKLKLLSRELRKSEETIREILGVPDGIEDIIFINEKMASFRTVLEEMLHVLEGDVDLDDAAMDEPSWGYAGEVVNDFLQLMFFPEDGRVLFISGYTRWTEEEKKFLLARYRDEKGRDPNTDLRECIKALLEDVSNNPTLTVGGKQMHVIDLLSGGENLPLAQYLFALLKYERFSKYPTLRSFAQRSNLDSFGVADPIESGSPMQSAVRKASSGVRAQFDKQSISILGASGHIGSLLFARVLEKARVVLPVFINRQNEYAPYEKGYQHWDKVHPFFFKLPDGNSDLATLVEKSDTVFHLAGRATAVATEHEGAFSSQDLLAEALIDNALSTGALVAFAKKSRNKPRVIFASSLQVYDLADWQASAQQAVEELSLRMRPEAEKWIDGTWTFLDGYINEFLDRENARVAIIQYLSEHPLPVGFENKWYAISKIIGERFVSGYQNGVSVRLGGVYGPGISGEDLQELADRPIERWVSQALQNKEISYVPGSLKNYIYIEDAVAALMNIAGIPSGQSVPKVINVGASRLYSTDEIINVIAETTGLSAERIKKDSMAGGGSPRPLLAMNALEDATGMRTKDFIPIEEGVRRYVRWVKTGEGYSGTWVNRKLSARPSAGNNRGVSVLSDSSGSSAQAAADASASPAEAPGVSSAVHLPSTLHPAPSTIGGIDFRFLPIVTQAMSNLGVNLRDSPLRGQSLSNVNLDEEWLAIEHMASSGIKPSAERIKEYAQASSALGKIGEDRGKIMRCISGMWRKDEEEYCETEPTLLDIVIILESVQNPQQLKEIFLGKPA